MSTFGTCYTRRQGFCQRYDKFIRIGGCRLLARDDRNHRAKKLISGKVHDSFSGVKRRLVTRSSSMIVAAPATHVQLAGQRTARQVLHAATSNDIHSARADNSHDADVVVVGAGIGGLCCGAMLAYYGFSVTVVESHSIPGGAAHSFHRDGFIFDSGPSFHMGLSDRDDGNAPNALKVVLDLLGEPLPCAAYDGWTCYFPEGQFNVKANAEAYHAEIERVGGAEACEQFKKFEATLKPLGEFSYAMPFPAVRADLGAVRSLARYFPNLSGSSLFKEQGLLKAVSWLQGPIKNIIDEVVTDPFLLRLLDLECFVISGLLAKDTMAPEMASIYSERHRPGAVLDYPLGGGQSIIDALVRGLEKNGGRLMLGTHIKQILVEGGRATGVQLRSGGVIRAHKAVVTNASVWDTQTLLPSGAVSSKDSDKSLSTPETKSFVHLHLGIDATGLPPSEELGIHHLVVNDWDLGVDGPQNVVNISIPTVLDPSLAPEGKHVVHAYTAGNEPYDLWKGLDRASEEYKRLKAERSEVLWKALERVIPDVRKRVEVSMVGTPLTQERFVRRHRGTYGAANLPGQWPGPATAVSGLFACGDSCFPGIGVPAVAASGVIAANTIAPLAKHLDALDVIEEFMAAPGGGYTKYKK